MRTHICRAILALVAAALASTAFADDSHPHWTYEGKGGPERWGTLSQDFAACSKGHQQSPVNLTNAHSGHDVTPALDWKPFAPIVHNNGHTIQASAAPGNTTTLSDRTYTLQQMHFHHPSEHTIDGKAAPMEAHFVNQAADGKLLVLGVMIDEGAPNAEIAKLWEVAPQTTGDAKAKADIDFSKLIPLGSKFYSYAGSLTTPPCSEIVDWIVYATPVTASREQIEAFARLYPTNNRPLQALHDRTIMIER
jgi:carbonic anhydrase